MNLLFTGSMKFILFITSFVAMLIGSSFGRIQSNHPDYYNWRWDEERNHIQQKLARERASNDPRFLHFGR
ncbi:hypothetical protein TELCIR_04690 [Teladorsagia circumcincta]|uniref:Uncharacterized protein n=1 Tax=Teladorsagia circumcincta TaxID=45464 RepID=A0A2G9USX2_TELCI|nr:hypothetical protein TELCIR_04690 [Teladorsagia circumcincta]